MSDYNSHAVTKCNICIFYELTAQQHENVYVFFIYNSVTPNYILINAHFMVLLHKGGF
jgi:hypothetical protein